MQKETEPEKPNSVKIRLFGKEYNIKGHGDKEYILDLAGYIAERAGEIGEKTAAVSTLDIAVLTLLNITDELFQERISNKEAVNQAD